MFKRSAIARVGYSLSLLTTASLMAVPVLAQSATDIIRIGNSSQDWQYYQSYWGELLNLSDQAAQERQFQAASPEDDPQAEFARIIKNLKIRKLFLEPIIKLNGSSQVFGVLTNQNDRPVMVSGINFEILDKGGYPIQTGSAQPEPSILAPGQTVTFTRTLLTVPADAGYEVKLSEPAFVIAPDPIDEPLP